jgi:hypothetical protein
MEDKSSDNKTTGRWIKDPREFVYLMMQPDIAEIIKSDQKSKERIVDILDTLLDIMMHRPEGNDEFFKLVELLDKTNSPAADDYLKLYEEVIKNRNIKY